MLPIDNGDDALLTCSKCKTTVHERCWNDYRVRQFSLIEAGESAMAAAMAVASVEATNSLYKHLCRCPSCRSTLKLAGRPRPMDDVQEAIECFDNDTSEAYFTRTPSLKRLSLQRQIKNARKKVTQWDEMFEKYPWIRNVERAIEHRNEAKADLKKLQEIQKARQNGGSM